MMATSKYSQKVLKEILDLNVKTTIFNALEDGNVSCTELIQLVEDKHNARLSMTDEDFENAKHHYRDVSRYVRHKLIRIQQESHS